MCIYIFTYINTIDKNPNEMKTAKRITRKKKKKKTKRKEKERSRGGEDPRLEK